MTTTGPIADEHTPHRCVVVIPAWNEEAAIADVIRKVPRELAPGWTVSVLVVDDGSTDGTQAAALSAGCDHVHSLDGHRGLGAAVRIGLQKAYALGADVAVLVDADNEYPADEIPQLIAPILAGEADYVIGARFLRPVSGMQPVRRMGNAVFTALQGLLLRRRLNDGQSGMRALSRSALAAFEIVHDYNYAQVLTLNLVRQGFRLAEVPISYRVRTTGRSFIGWDYLWRVPPAIGREWLAGRDKP
jgi:glycosyltransferase involved in cell wall biosynthesis